MVNMPSPTEQGCESSPMETVRSLPELVVLSIIVSNYNARELLRTCLTSLYQHPPTCSFNIIVVDDASWDGSDEMVRECFPQVHLLRTDRNLNYGGANNQALDFVQCEFVCLLNNDTVMLPHALDDMVTFLHEHPKAGAVGCKLLNADGSIQASVKTLPSLLSGLFGDRSPITKLFPGNRFSRQHLLHLSRDMTRPFTAGYVSSACVIMRQEVVKKVGHLDVRLTYHVDADYCRRIWDAGWEVYYLPTAVVIHDAHKGGTMVTIRRRLKAVIEFHRGSYIYFQKHQMKSVWEPMHFVVIAGLAVRFLMSLLLQTSKEFLRPFHTG
jgi:N-acetylglucosaminyl-diphospho-decaprenol L-rhamnosyltransferase